MPTVLIVAVLLAFSIQEPSVTERIQEESLVTFVKGIPVKELDSSLPKMRLERWLMDVAGRGITLRWEVNDCGELSGDASDANRKIPVCVQASADLPGQRGFAVQILVGVAGGKTQKPSLRSTILQRDRKLFELKKLSDLQRELSAPVK